MSGPFHSLILHYVPQAASCIYCCICWNKKVIGYCFAGKLASSDTSRNENETDNFFFGMLRLWVYSYISATRAVWDRSSATTVFSICCQSRVGARKCPSGLFLIFAQEKILISFAGFRTKTQNFLTLWVCAVIFVMSSLVSYAEHLWMPAVAVLMSVLLLAP